MIIAKRFSIGKARVRLQDEICSKESWDTGYFNFVDRYWIAYFFINFHRGDLQLNTTGSFFGFNPPMDNTNLTDDEVRKIRNETERLLSRAAPNETLASGVRKTLPGWF